MFHGDESRVLMQADVEDDDDSGMKQAARRPRFPEQPFLQELSLARVHARLQADYLYCNAPPDHGIHSVVNDTHGAAPQFTTDEIAPDLPGIADRGVEERIRFAARSKQALYFAGQ